MNVRKVVGTGCLVWGLLILALCWGCGPTAKVVDKGGPTIQGAQLEPATGEKLRIAVMDFDNRTRHDVGRGMRAMLTSALFRTGRFIVLEREKLKDVLMEQRLGPTGVVSPETAPPVGQVEGAQVLIYGTVTEFEPGRRGIMTILGGAAQSSVAIDIKLVDTRTSRTLGATTVVGKGTDVRVDTTGLKYAGVSPLYGLEVWNNTPVESAIRLCIERAVESVFSKLYLEKVLLIPF